MAARGPYVAEIGFTGRAPGYYNLFLGGGFHGQRLNRLLLENIGEEKILEVLTPMFRAYAAERQTGRAFRRFRHPRRLRPRGPERPHV